MYIEMSLEEAEKLLKNSKHKKVLVSVQSLEEDEVKEFSPRLKEDCLKIIKESETIAKCNGDIVDSIKAFSEKQNIFEIKRKGNMSTFLINSKSSDMSL